MATAGHFVTMVGVCCFYLALFDAHRLGRTATSPTLLIPRFNKRVLYYIFKITQIQQHNKVFANLPNVQSRLLLLEKLQINNVDF